VACNKCSAQCNWPAVSTCRKPQLLQHVQLVFPQMCSVQLRTSMAATFDPASQFTILRHLANCHPATFASCLLASKGIKDMVLAVPECSGVRQLLLRSRDRKMQAQQLALATRQQIKHAFLTRIIPFCSFTYSMLHVVIFALVSWTSFYNSGTAPDDSWPAGPASAGAQLLAMAAVALGAAVASSLLMLSLLALLCKQSLRAYSTTAYLAAAVPVVCLYSAAAMHVQRRAGSGSAQTWSLLHALDGTLLPAVEAAAGSIWTLLSVALWTSCCQSLLLIHICFVSYQDEESAQTTRWMLHRCEEGPATASNRHHGA
jgi:hypothetical protein